MDSKGHPGKDPARWEQRYVDKNVPWDSGRPDQHLKNFIGQFEPGPGKALEIGCGTGTNVIWLQGQGFEVLGLDLSPTAIAQARDKAAAAGTRCQLRVADFLAEPVPEGPFQLVYDRGCFHVFDDPGDRTRFATRIAELLEPGGTWHSLIGSTDGPPRDSGPPRRSAAEIMAALEPHFEILSLESTLWDEDSFNQARAWRLVARRRSL